MALSLTSYGGAGCVTGSRHLLQVDKQHILLDCGLFQGVKVLRERNWQPLPVDPRTIDAVVLTHAHLDHSGYLPRLVKEGFAGPVYCTAATRDLAEVLLLDSAHLAEKDAEYANRKGFSRHKPALPLYTTRDVDRAMQLFRPISFHAAQEVAGAQLTFHRAGHILGAAIAELRCGERVVVFSGDLGRYDDAFMHDPEAVAHADYVLVESTYGDRTHPAGDPVAALGAAIERTVRRGGTVVIPAFAVGRTQVLLHHLWKLKTQKRLGAVPIFLDSPMAIRATELLRRHPDDHRFDAETCAATCDVATYVRDVQESKDINANPMPKIVIAGSGMATGGRVLHHIRAYAPDPRHMILFAGYQAPGTRGARLLAGDGEVKIFGEWIPVRAEIANLPELSAHADSGELLRWLGGFATPPRQTFVVHGEPEASDTLRRNIERMDGWNASVVAPMTRYRLG